MAVAGGKRGGPAKVAVIGSALFGTISGNSAANVVASGTFTIPMMIKVGYSPRFASAVEAVASTGGQMTPPILGGGGVHHRRADGHPVSRRGPRHGHSGDPLFRLDLLHDRP
ncbi:MAG: TRAP transporter large permease subunit [Bilophila wadsworthia]|uniref:TRAP transporter large permease subunit n=1 Tax=Bilophila wadsworthia TaxID=35833 RepID=UPI00300F00F4